MSQLVNREFALTTMKGEKDSEGQIVYTYLPRKCSVTSKILGPKDRSSIQFSLPKVDSMGKATRETEETIAISGYIRNKGRSDWEIEKLLRSKGIYPLADEQ